MLCGAMGLNSVYQPTGPKFQYSNLQGQGLIFMKSGKIQKVYFPPKTDFFGHFQVKNMLKIPMVR